MLNGSTRFDLCSTCGGNDTVITVIRLLRFIPCDFNFFYKTNEAKSNFNANVMRQKKVRFFVTSVDVPSDYVT